MTSSGPFLHRLFVGTAACSALLVVGVAPANAAPASDSRGFVDSTARCADPNVAVAFGNTETSRVAICETPSGAYEYRGVRVRDGARLILSASESSEGEFVADNQGIDYTVTSNSLTVSEGGDVIRRESWVSFQGPDTPAVQEGTSTPSAPPTATPTPSPTSTTPLPPPLPAEVGGSSTGA